MCVSFSLVRLVMLGPGLCQPLFACAVRIRQQRGQEGPQRWRRLKGYASFWFPLASCFLCPSPSNTSSPGQQQFRRDMAAEDGLPFSPRLPNHLNRYTPLYIKEINNTDIFYSPGNYIQYLVMTYNGKESYAHSRSLFRGLSSQLTGALPPDFYIHISRSLSLSFPQF